MREELFKYRKEEADEGKRRRRELEKRIRKLELREMDR